MISTLAQIAEYARRFYRPGDRKITLNFALARDVQLEANVLRRHFDPDLFLIKITPINPTFSAARNALFSQIDPDQLDATDAVVDGLRRAGC